MAELSSTKEIVGMIRGCIKTVTCGKKLSRNGKNNDPIKPLPVFTKLAYILGLRVSPLHRFFCVLKIVLPIMGQQIIFSTLKIIVMINDINFGLFLVPSGEWE